MSSYSPRGSIRTSVAAFCAVTFGLFGHSALAAPPGINTAPIPVALPDIGESVEINLRQLDVLTGSGPLTINANALTVLVNGQPDTVMFANLIESGPGAVCVSLFNSDIGLEGNTFELQIAVANMPGTETFGPVVIPLVNAPGPGFDVESCGDANTPPVANAGGDRTIADTDGQPGESVVLDGSASTDADPGTILTYQWSANDAFLGPPSTNPILTVSLPDGVTEVFLEVIDDSDDDLTNFDGVGFQITVNAPQGPTVDAGPDQTLPDSDGQPGEPVTLTGTASDQDGTIASYEWRLGDTVLGSTQTLVTTLPDGVNDVVLTVTDNSGLTASDTVQITVNGAELPTANAGADQTLADTDGELGELVTLSGTATDPDGAIVSFEWFMDDSSLGLGATIEVSLPDGVNLVTLVVTDDAGNTATDTVQITIAVAPETPVLSEIPNLTPNQQKVAVAVDRICTDLRGMADGEAALTDPQQQLLQRCGELLASETTQQIETLDELVADDFAAARTQTLVFANTQHASVMDRMIALRGGAKGLSLAGLNIMVDGKMIPLAQLQQMAKGLLGSGASADEPGGLLSDKWGLWARGNYSFGKKDANAQSPSFEADQWSVVGGVDYRLSSNSVVGVSLAYGDASVDFSPSGEGSLDTESWAVSLYGSLYATKNFYLDTILNVADSTYDATRNITFVDGAGLVDFDARGDTDGITLSVGLSGGYDFQFGGLTLSPNAGFFYIDTSIDGFTEKGAAGLNLIYDKQTFESLTGNLGLRMTYAWNTSWGVLLPHLRADYVREFEDDVDVFGVRFAADPNATSAPPILVETDNPDTSYWRLAAGLSAQFKYGVSGYVEYQRLESFEFLSFEDVSVGVRFQRSF